MNRSSFCFHAHAHMWMTRYTIIPVVSHYCTDQQVAVARQKTQQCTNTGREGEDGRLVNNAGSNMLLWKCFMRKEMHSSHLLDLKDTQQLHNNSQYKYNFCFLTRKLHRAALTKHLFVCVCTSFTMLDLILRRNPNHLPSTCSRGKSRPPKCFPTRPVNQRRLCQYLFVKLSTFH